jgi:hypothetical protein
MELRRGRRLGELAVLVQEAPGRPFPRLRSAFAVTVRARSGGYYGDLSVPHSESVRYGGFVWVRRALSDPFRWFPARAVLVHALHPNFRRPSPRAVTPLPRRPLCFITLHTPPMKHVSLQGKGLTYYGE